MLIKSESQVINNIFNIKRTLIPPLERNECRFVDKFRNLIVEKAMLKKMLFKN